MSTRANIFTTIAIQLNALGIKATKSLLNPVMIVKQLPYVGVIAGKDTLLQDVKDGQRTKLTIKFELCDTSDHIETLIETVKDYLASNPSLDANCKSIRYIDSEDVIQAKDANYVKTTLYAIAIYTELSGTAVVDFTGGMIGTGVYRVYAWLSSGSLGATVYPTQYKAGITLPAITVDPGTPTTRPSDASNYGNTTIINHNIPFVIRIHTRDQAALGFDTKLNIELKDAVWKRLRERTEYAGAPLSSGSYILGDTFSTNMEATFVATAATGVMMTINLTKVEEYNNNHL